MKKKILPVLIILLIYSCSSVKKTRQAINKGNYETAINIAVKKLQNNKSKKRLEELTTNEIIKLAKDII